MGNESRKWLLVTTGLGILIYAGWTLFLVFWALMAESGGKEPQPLLAVALLWPLGELIATWMWVAAHGERYTNSSRRGLGDGLLMIALVAPIPLYIGLADLMQPHWVWVLVAPMAVTIAGCWAARLVWSKSEQKTTASQ
jgi:hypothetical protein